MNSFKSIFLLFFAALILFCCDSSTSVDESSDNQDDEVPEVNPVENNRLIGAHYYPWWGKPNGHFPWLSEVVSTPKLGEYRMHNMEVVNQHIKWAVEHGINWFSVSWWGPSVYEDRTLKNYLLASPLSKHMKFSILYESLGRFNFTTPINMDNEENRQQFADDIEYLANTYFNRSEYLKINGQPVIFIYNAYNFEGDVVGAFQYAFEQAGVNPYVIADLGFSIGPNFPMAPVTDAVSGYTLYTANPDIENEFNTFFKDVLNRFNDLANNQDYSFIPMTIPGFNDTELSTREDNPILEASPERFARVSTYVEDFIDPNNNAMFITSFNEWYENTQLEPSEEYGTQYLEVVRDSLVQQ